MKEEEPKPGYLGNKLDGITQPVPSDAWNDIEKKLDKDKRRRFIIWWFLPVLTLFGLFTGYYFFQESSSSLQNEKLGKIETAKKGTSEVMPDTENGDHGKTDQLEVVTGSETLPNTKNTPNDPTDTNVEKLASAETPKSKGYNIENQVNDSQNGNESAKKAEPELQKESKIKNRVVAEPGDLALSESKPESTKEEEKVKSGSRKQHVRRSNFKKKLTPSAIAFGGKQSKVGKSAGKQKLEDPIVIKESEMVLLEEQKSTNGSLSDSEKLLEQTPNQAQTKVPALAFLQHKNADVLAPDFEAKRVLMFTLEVPEITGIDTATLPEQRRKLKFKSINLFVVHGGLLQQSISILALPDLDQESRPQIAISPGNLKRIKLSKVEYSKLLKLTESFMVGAGFYGIVYRQIVEAQLEGSRFTSIKYQPTEDSLTFSGSPAYATKKGTYSRWGWEGGMQASLFFKPGWSPIGIRFQATIASLNYNWVKDRSMFLPHAGVGLFYTSPSKWFFNAEYQSFRKAGNVLPIEVKTTGTTSGLSFGIGYYW